MLYLSRFTRSFFKHNVHVLVVMAILWALALDNIFPKYEVPISLKVGFIFGTALLSFTMLKACEYFAVLRPLPRPSDILTAIVTAPIAAVSVVILIRVATWMTVCPIKVVAPIALAIGALTFALHYAISQILFRSGKRVKVVLYLNPAERELVSDVLASLDLPKYLEILDAHTLKEYFIRGAESEIDLIVISKEAASAFERESLLIRCHLAGIPIVDHMSLVSTLPGRIHLDVSEPWSYLLSATPQTFLMRLFWNAKTILEPLAAAVMGVILLPVVLVVALAIKLNSPGPIFYRQVRVGHLGKHFVLIKFRSMRTDAEANGPQWASSNDSRVTGVGAFLRRTRLDEIPQLWNVMRGEMGFVGPRPERPEIYQQLRKSIPLFSLRTIVRPGITGWAQVCAGYASTIEESRTKLEYDLYYIQNMSPRHDFIVLLKTVQVALFGDAKAPRLQTRISAPRPLNNNMGNVANNVVVAGNVEARQHSVI